jgi:cell division protein FtsL
MRAIASPLRIAIIWVLVVVSALAVALVSHLSRQQYAQLGDDGARGESNECGLRQILA